MGFPTRIAKRWLGFGNRRPATTVDAVILHWTAGGTGASSYSWLLQLLRNGKSGDDASYHVICERDGSRLKTVPLSKRAWHAGICYAGCGRNDLDVNEYSIGFAWANRGDGEKITQAQIDSFVEWVAEAKAQFPNLKFLGTHAGIAYPRKNDPDKRAITDAQLQEIAQRTGLRFERGRRP